MATKKTAIATVVVEDYVHGQTARLVMQHKNIFIDDLVFFGNGTKLKLTIEKYYRQRSNSQNGVLHWYCTELADYLGMEMEDFKTMMKQKFLTWPVPDKRDNGEEWLYDPETGEVMTYIPSTSDLTTVQMMDFIEKIRMWALYFLKYELPLPDANYKIHFLHEKQEQLKLNIKNNGKED